MSGNSQPPEKEKLTQSIGVDMNNSTSRKALSHLNMQPIYKGMPAREQPMVRLQNNIGTMNTPPTKDQEQQKDVI